EYRHELVEERWLNAKLVAVADRAANDAPEHIPAHFVQRQHTVNDQEGARADMIRDDPQRAGCQVIRSGELGRGSHEFPEEIDVVVGMHSLHDGGSALEAHSGIHGRLRQWCELAVRGALELYEHEVPDLH